MDATLSPSPSLLLLLRPRCTLIDFAVFVLDVLNAAEGKGTGGQGDNKEMTTNR